MHRLRALHREVIFSVFFCRRNRFREVYLCRASRCLFRPDPDYTSNAESAADELLAVLGARSIYTPLSCS